VDRFGNPHAPNLSYARGAILSSLVDLTFTDLRQLADIAAGLFDVGNRHRLGRITGELVEAVEYRAQLRECVEATMGSLRKQPENAVASSWQASAPAPFYSRHPQCSMPNGISVYVSALPRVPEPSLPASVLLLVTLLDRPVLWASDLAQVPSLA
jgi:hypothetical protein